ncbi:ladderlectin-like [Clupea harengus]|uniref:Ladderlectin-like n=1 Tax=Clupea harengus TaxID=7950 RepID=A0A6P8F059_CLUHA|nr:ladderlectin-like [Clupea harengus]
MMKKASILLLSAFLTAAFTCTPPTAEQKSDEGNMGACKSLGTRCFKFVSTARAWAESERHCVAMGGNLASVHSIDEYSFIQDLIREHTDGTPRTWIGGYDAVQEGLWFWSDGSRFDYTNWYPGEPNNSGSEHCIEMNFGGTVTNIH